MVHNLQSIGVWYYIILNAFGVIAILLFGKNKEKQV